MWQRSTVPPVVTGVATHKRDVLVTDVMDAEPTHVSLFPEPSIWPFLTAVASGGLIVSIIFTPWGFVIGAVPVTFTLIGWFWPKQPAEKEVSEMMLPGAPDPLVPEARP